MAQIFITDDLPIRVTSRGTWLHGTEPLHPRVQSLFSRNVRPTDHGPYKVQLGHAQAELEVDDTPYFVKSISLTQTDDGQLQDVMLSLSDDTTEPLHLHTLMQSDAYVFYCRIQRHGFWVPCRFTSSQYHSLGEYLDIRDDQGVLIAQNRAWPIRAYDSRPQPESRAVT